MPLSKAQAVLIQAEAYERMTHAEKITAAELYERHLKDVYRYVWQRVPGIEEARDITAEVFTQPGWLRWPPFKMPPPGRSQGCSGSLQCEHRRGRRSCRPRAS